MPVSSPMQAERGSRTISLVLLGGGSLISRFSEVALINKQIPVLPLDLIEAVG